MPAKRGQLPDPEKRASKIRGGAKKTGMSKARKLEIFSDYI
jgi:hypothetical protein